MKQILSVVYYCHSSNIVNRDLRPENILVESIDKKYINGIEIPLFNIRIADFKSARSFKKSKKLNKKVGNPYYIAPEVLKRRYNEKCDLWSCGIIMYILLTGKPPFSGNSDKEVLDKVEAGTFEFFGIYYIFIYLDNDFFDNTHECRALLKDLLRVDPVKRVSAVDAIKHKWFNIHNLNLSIERELVNDAFKNFMQFSPEQKFQQAAIAYMVHHLIDINEVKDYKRLFEVLDTNCDGKLSHNELMEGFKKYIPVNQKEKEFMKVVKKIDQDRSGYIEYEGN